MCELLVQEAAASNLQFGCMIGFGFGVILTLLVSTCFNHGAEQKMQLKVYKYFSSNRVRLQQTVDYAHGSFIWAGGRCSAKQAHVYWSEENKHSADEASFVFFTTSAVRELQKMDAEESK